jgi:hypothetical protein
VFVTSSPVERDLPLRAGEREVHEVHWGHAFDPRSCSSRPTRWNAKSRSPLGVISSILVRVRHVLPGGTKSIGVKSIGGEVHWGHAFDRSGEVHWSHTFDPRLCSSRPTRCSAIFPSEGIPGAILLPMGDSSASGGDRGILGWSWHDLFVSSSPVPSIM